MDIKDFFAAKIATERLSSIFKETKGDFLKLVNLYLIL